MAIGFVANQLFSGTDEDGGTTIANYGKRTDPRDGRIRSMHRVGLAEAETAQEAYAKWLAAQPEQFKHPQTYAVKEDT